MVVDDEPFIRFSLNYALSREGYNVKQPSDGLDSLALILEAQDRKEPFDLLMTDIQMPGMSGIKLINELKLNKISFPIFAISAGANEELVNDLLNNGCLDYIQKPFNFQELVERVSAVLENRNHV